MSDLISRSALIEEISKQVNSWGKQGIIPSLFSAIAIVKNQPTAYDVEKVVEQLEELKANAWDEEYQTMCRAIDIVLADGKE